MNELRISEGLRELHLFAGAGGGILGGMLLGHTCVCAVEIEHYCRKVMFQRQRDGILPGFPIWSDIRTFNGIPWRGRVDAICGGFPCQRWSTAASGRNNAADLWPEMRRVVADVAPWIVFAENVSEDAIQVAAKDCRAMGYKAKCISLSAADVGADHIRERYWLFAHAYNESELQRIKHAEMARMPGIYPRVWQSFCNESRMADGVAHRMDRFKATGNGQVPAVARLAWETLINQSP